MKRPVPIGLAAILSVVLIACTVSAGPPVAVQPSATAEALAASPTPSVVPIPTPVASPEPSPSGATKVRAYFMLGGPSGGAGLVPVLREIADSKAVARAALDALIDGPNADERGASPAISSEVPEQARLLDLSIERGVATVDLSAAFESGGKSASHIARLGQVVYTLTHFPTVKSVSFRIGGRPVTEFGDDGVVLDGPVGRDDLAEIEPFQSMFEGALPAIFVDGPAWGAALDNPATITGTANTYEAWLLVELYDASGRQLYERASQATCGTGCRGSFDVTVAYSVSAAQLGILRVFDGDENGDAGVSRDYPVWLTPGPPLDGSEVCGC